MPTPPASLVKPDAPETAAAPPADAEVEVAEIELNDFEIVEVAAAPLVAAEPSPNELVERAAALGPMRPTWASFVLPHDPILDEKRQPRVAERRARFTRMVKATLGGCVAVCVVATIISAVSALTGSDARAASTSMAALGKTSQAVTPVETAAASFRAKAGRRVIPAATTAKASPKRR